MQIPMEIGGTGSSLLQRLRSGPATRPVLSPDSGVAPRRVRDLSPQQRAELRELQQTDRAVRAHEAAHKAAAGPHARGGPSFEYQRGPDGRRYAVGGEVHVDTAPVAGDPEATLRKMEQVKRAA